MSNKGLITNFKVEELNIFSDHRILSVSLINFDIPLKNDDISKNIIENSEERKNILKSNTNFKNIIGTDSFKKSIQEIIDNLHN